METGSQNIPPWASHPPIDYDGIGINAHKLPGLRSSTILSPLGKLSGFPRPRPLRAGRSSRSTCSCRSRAPVRMTLIVLSLFLPLFISLGPLPSAAAVIFEDNFDSQPDWNVNKQYEGSECSPIGYSGAGNICSTGAYPPGWTHFRSMPGSSSFVHPVISIGRLPNNLPDHTTGSGKAIIIYNESNSYNPGYWAGDGNIGKYFGPSADYPELYVRMWIRTQSGWQSMDSAQSKVFRVTHWRATENIMQVANEHTPIYFWDWGQWGGKATYIPAYRCEAMPYLTGSGVVGRSSDYYCGGLDSAHDYEKNDIQTIWGSGAPSTKFADGTWHRYDFHLKMNDIGSANGLLEWWYDGTLVQSITNVIWKEPSASASIGWNNVWLGGNSNNAFGSYSEQWYAIDDVVVSTTPILDNYVIGGGTTNTTPPTAPTGLRIQ